MTTPVTIICEQCVAWHRPREAVTFTTVEAAEEHVERYHSNRLLLQYRKAITDLEDGEGWKDARLFTLLEMLEKRKDV